MNPNAFYPHRSWLSPRYTSYGAQPGSYMGLGSPEERIQHGFLGSPEERVVGLDPSDPGSQWGQAPSEKEKAQGYKTTDLLTLQIKVGKLRSDIENLLSQVDPSTDASALAALKNLHDSVVSLDTAVAARVGQGFDSPSLNYPTLLLKYNGYAATFASFGVEEAQAPAPKPTPSNPTPPPPPTKTVQPPAPGAPTITTKPGTPWWAYPLAIGLGLIGIVLLKAGKAF